ncbi:L-serine ammonia-lyase, iron-sulfur-dependent subunit beta [Caproiciproducens sp. MSJ-32]|uniref:L-serine ammonia-lyase, iron-sulfur-dependent subunit beta n=1 Tax=Caproiciproducens sp. MSJ-32 TaxID=2841527 RepID=UPI001C11968B|nr:L-serine ammonia-lyase, iron-sulfur-dependent subunit beta [Caproiciproducens sp. MSJ-32]MBU5454128.1 L-serine ammonia-lyase, iron-sulfur-dependent subunit beta [Caproiciproducens sp. MSJ-32]
MSGLGVFDIIGPIMVGPSSSHTAGAARLAKVARAIAGCEVKEVTFLLHGSFAKTYKGHGTDRALAAGILGMNPSDDRLRDSLKIAREKGVNIIFKEEDLGDCHPNTVKFLIKCANNKSCEIVGSSIGGGNIEIVEINGSKVHFTGSYDTIITTHRDIPGTVAKVTNILYSSAINIAFMNLERKQKGKIATMTFELDSKVDKTLIEKIKKVEGIEKVILIEKVEDGE